MARDDAQLKLRVPAALKEQLEQAAKLAGRSINAEVLFRLTETFEQVYINDDVESRLDGLEDRVWDILYTLGDSLKYRPDKLYRERTGDKGVDKPLSAEDGGRHSSD